jgi:hypothetical protein
MNYPQNKAIQDFLKRVMKEREIMNKKAPR